MKRFNTISKRFLVVLSTITFLSGCGSSAAKVDDSLMNHFSSDYRILLTEANPDVVSMEYLVEHASDYACDYDSDRNDFFVVLHGSVTDMNIVEYDEEILSRMSEDIADTLRNSVRAELYLDDCDVCLDIDLGLHDVEIGSTYYFFVSVREMDSGYSFSAYEVFDFE